jgi:thioredoxin 1
MAGNVIELTDETFDETIQGDLPVLVDFWAPWCGPCKMMVPIIEQVANEYTGKAMICKMDTDEHRQAAITYAISAIPTLILFKDGQMVKKWVGLTQKNVIMAAIDEQLAS